MNIQISFSFFAGLLTTLSPCVLPILPFLLGSALQRNKKSPLFMIIGLASSFVIVGYTISRFGSVFGLDSEEIRKGSAFFLCITSIFFLSKKIQIYVSEKLISIANFGSNATRKMNLSESSNLDSVLIGGLLGTIWSPCIGPTLGVAISMASQEGSNQKALLLIAIYSLGASIPMLLISYGMRSFFQRYQNKILKISENSKTFLGLILFLSGISIFFGIDKTVESYLLKNLPNSWVELITKY